MVEKASVIKATREKEKRRISLYKMVQDKMVANRNKWFTPNHEGRVQWSRNPKARGGALSPFRDPPLRVSFSQAILRMENEKNIMWP